MRARPYKLQNHILIPEDDSVAILKIIESFVLECKKIDIAITGGETSIHNNISGLELSVTVDGFVQFPMSNKFKEGDYLIGIKVMAYIAMVLQELESYFIMSLERNLLNLQRFILTKFILLIRDFQFMG